MAEIQVTFPESISETQMRSVVALWEKSLGGYKIHAERSNEYTAVEMLAFTNGGFNLGFLTALSRPIEQILESAEFELNVQTQNNQHSYSKGQWQ